MKAVTNTEDRSGETKEVDLTTVAKTTVEKDAVHRKKILQRKL